MDHHPAVKMYEGWIHAIRQLNSENSERIERSQTKKPCAVGHHMTNDKNDNTRAWTTYHWVTSPFPAIPTGLGCLDRGWETASLLYPTLSLQKVFLLFHVCRWKETEAQMTVTRPVNHSGLHHVSLVKWEIGLSCLNHFLRRILIYKIDKTDGADWRGLGVQPTPQSLAPQPRLCSFRLKQQLFPIWNLGFKSC